MLMLAGTISLIVALFRILNRNYPRDKPEQYYRQTLMIFVVGICLAFLGAFIDMFVHFMVG